jgi:quinol-cytochrome oxidoreductase complex cytochrome b subunit
MDERDGRLASGEKAGRGWAQRFGLPTLGALTLGALAVCVVSGVVVATGYDAARPVHSVLAFEVGRPYGWFFRALHAHSAQLGLLGLIAHTLEYLARGGERQVPPGHWVVVMASLPVTLYLMLGGRALVGDAEGNGVAAVMRGLLEQLPVFGAAAADVLVGANAGGDMTLLLTHHVSSATLLLLVLTVAHLKRVVPDAAATAVALGLSGAVALAVRPAVVMSDAPVALEGPWYMAGLRLMLQHLPAWFAGLAVPLSFYLLLSSLPWVPEVRVRAVRFVIFAIGVAYGLLIAVAELT